MSPTLGLIHLCASRAQHRVSLSALHTIDVNNYLLNERIPLSLVTSLSETLNGRPVPTGPCVTSAAWYSGCS